MGPRVEVLSKKCITLTHTHTADTYAVSADGRFHMIYISFRSVVSTRVVVVVVFFPFQMDGVVPVCMSSNNNNDCQSFSRAHGRRAQAQNLFHY